jgi:capsid protein
MAIHLIEKLQSNLGYPALHKIDPNIDTEDTNSSGNALGQAVVPVALLGLYKYTRSNENADLLQRGNNSTDWAKEIFDDSHQKIVQKVAAHAHVDKSVAETALGKAFQEAIAIIKREIGEQTDGSALRDFITDQRTNILLYLPPSLHIGENLNDSTIDDRTNKMEGPVSSFLHTVEKIFSVSDSDKDEKI